VENLSGSLTKLPIHAAVAVDIRRVMARRRNKIGASFISRDKGLKRGKWVRNGCRMSMGVE
jgi:hypothetical protein